MKLEIERIAGTWAVARLAAQDSVPDWAALGASLGDDAHFVSVTRTRDELSIVTLESRVPASQRAERGMALWRVVGTLDFDEVGVLARIVTPLAAAGISVLAIATFDTDYLLLRQERSEDAVAALRSAGIIIL